MPRMMHVWLVFFCLTATQPPWVLADEDDTSEVEDIDAGARSETDTDDSIVRDAVGPGQPQDPQPTVPTVYDGYGNAYIYGYPYGYSYPYSYGSGYMYGYGNRLQLRNAPGGAGAARR